MNERDVDTREAQPSDELMQEGETPSSTPTPQPKRRLSRKTGMVLGVVAVVVVVAGAGLWIWHEQPSFCSTICHSPMGSYVDGYYEADTLMADRHLEADVSCLECHEPSIGQQVSEAAAWVSGTYEDPMGANGLANEQGFCLRSGCHTEGSWHDRHDSLPLENTEGCAECHQMHLNHTSWVDR